MDEPPIPFSAETFLEHCAVRYGNANPERVRSPVWEYMARTSRVPFGVRMQLGLQSNRGSCCSASGCTPPQPDWCFDRFGMTRTRMPDGRIICIAGEYEDWYDPDFRIYNDVTVMRPAPGKDAVDIDSGDLELYAYPAAEFPSTDFHSATLVGDRIYIIGSLGYRKTRDPRVTPVYVLDTNSYRIDKVDTVGRPPGWINSHHASYEPASHSIVIRGGEVLSTVGDRMVDSRAAFRLHLGHHGTPARWERIAASEPWTYCVLARDRDQWPEREYDIEQGLTPRRVPFTVAHYPKVGVTLALDVSGVRVSLRNEYEAIPVTVEGDLDATTIQMLMEDLAEELTDRLGVRYTCEPGRPVRFSRSNT